MTAFSSCAIDVERVVIDRLPPDTTYNPYLGDDVSLPRPARLACDSELDRILRFEIADPAHRGRRPRRRGDARRPGAARLSHEPRRDAAPRRSPSCRARRHPTSCCSTSGLPDVDGARRSAPPAPADRRPGDRRDRPRRPVARACRACAAAPTTTSSSRSRSPSCSRGSRRCCAAPTRRRRARGGGRRRRAVDRRRRAPRRRRGRGGLADAARSSTCSPRWPARPARRSTVSGCWSRSGRPTGRGWSRTLDVHIATLRAKLGRPDVVETVRGVGYRLATPAPRRRVSAAVRRRLLLVLLPLLAALLVALEVPAGPVLRRPPLAGPLHRALGDAEPLRRAWPTDPARRTGAAARLAGRDRALRRASTGREVTIVDADRAS